MEQDGSSESRLEDAVRGIYDVMFAQGANLSVIFFFVTCKATPMKGA